MVCNLFSAIHPILSFEPRPLGAFFAVIRSQNGNNPNPTCRMFISDFKGILMQAEIKIDSGNCSILQQNVSRRRELYYFYYYLLNY